MPFLPSHAGLTLILSLLLVDSTQSASPSHIRLGFTPTIVRKDGSHTVTLSKRESLSNPQITAIFGSFAALTSILFIVLMCTGGFRRAERYIRGRNSLGEDDQGADFRTLGSDMWSIRPNQGERRLEWRSQTSSMTVVTPAVMITVTSTDPDESLPRRPSAETTTSLPSISATLCTDVTRTTAVSSVLNPPRLLSQLTPTSSLNAINGSAQSSQIDATSEMVPEMISLRASHRLEPIRVLPTPSPTPSFDTLDDRSPSLAEFPSPPQLSFQPLPEISTSPLYFHGDLGDSRNIQSPVSPQFEPHPGSTTGVGSTSPDSNQGSDGPPSARRSRPPTYHSAWHRSTISMSTISTLPAYTAVEREDNNVIQVSRPRSLSRSSTKQRSARAAVVRPPLPIPPFPLPSAP